MERRIMLKEGKFLKLKAESWLSYKMWSSSPAKAVMGILELLKGIKRARE